ncbi:hypothetical protein AB1Y20_014849 [Prymnesium parvum]|uniref:Uncharacterized protein n=1 Tax=Prymnesium parvum TaxID=97485 RepID=A0AB34JZM5_PRYPA
MFVAVLLCGAAALWKKSPADATQLAAQVERLAAEVRTLHSLVLSQGSRLAVLEGQAGFGESAARVPSLAAGSPAGTGGELVDLPPPAAPQIDAAAKVRVDRKAAEKEAAKAKREAEAKAKREAEARAKREAEERRAAEAQARAAAAAKAKADKEAARQREAELKAAEKAKAREERARLEPRRPAAARPMAGFGSRAIPPLHSPQLRQIGAASLGQPLVATALAPAAQGGKGGSAPRYVAAADASGRIHLFDSAGRQVALPFQATESGRIVGMGFVAMGANVLLATAVDTGDATKFRFLLSRVAPQKNPQPTSRFALDIVREVDVLWHPPPPPPPKSKGKGARGKAGEEPVAEQEEAEAHHDDVALTSGVDLHMVAFESMPPGKNANAPVILIGVSDGTLIFLTSSGTVHSTAQTGVNAVRVLRRSGTTICLLSPERLVLVDLSGRLPARECSVPESVLADDGALTDAVFDGHLSQLLYVSTTAGDTLIFNTRARAVDEGEGAKARMVECRWLDSLVTDGPFSDEPLLSLATTRGYLFSAGVGHFTVRNVSTIYYQTEAPPAPLVFADQLPHKVDAGGSLPHPNEVHIRVEAGTVLLASAAAGSITLYTTTLIFEPPPVSMWPRIVMGVAAIGITVVWQLYRHKKRSAAEESGRASRGGKCCDRHGLTDEKYGDMGMMRRGAYGGAGGDWKRGAGCGARDGLASAQDAASQFHKRAYNHFDD